MGEREKEKMQREKNAEPSHGGLYTTRMDESVRARERERKTLLRMMDVGCPKALHSTTAHTHTLPESNRTGFSLSPF